MQKKNKNKNGHQIQLSSLKHNSLIMRWWVRENLIRKPEFTSAFRHLFHGLSMSVEMTGICEQCILLLAAVTVEMHTHLCFVSGV